MTCLMVSACSSARSMRWATSARGTDQPPLRFCPHAVRYVPVSGCRSVVAVVRRETATSSCPSHRVVERRMKMEPQPGVCVSKASTEDWVPDPDVPGSQMHELVHADGVWAGFCRFTRTHGPV